MKQGRMDFWDRWSWNRFPQETWWTRDESRWGDDRFCKSSVLCKEEQSFKKFKNFAGDELVAGNRHQRFWLLQRSWGFRRFCRKLVCRWKLGCRRSWGCKEDVLKRFWVKWDEKNWGKVKFKFELKMYFGLGKGTPQKKKGHLARGLPRENPW
ncbi:hypothetical protein ACS0TY_010532 [Phlomoides rotata]